MTADAPLEGRAFVDTNVLVYLHDTSEPNKQAVARSIMLNDDLDLIISAQVLGEFLVTVTRKIKPQMSMSAARETLGALAELHVVPITRNLVLDATELSEAHQLSYWDSLIVEAASAGGAGLLLTEDLAAGTTFRGVTVVNPFDQNRKQEFDDR